MTWDWGPHKEGASMDHDQNAADPNPAVPHLRVIPVGTSPKGLPFALYSRQRSDVLWGEMEERYLGTLREAGQGYVGFTPTQHTHVNWWELVLIAYLVQWQNNHMGLDPGPMVVRFNGSGEEPSLYSVGATAWAATAEGSIEGEHTAEGGPSAAAPAQEKGGRPSLVRDVTPQEAHMERLRLRGGSVYKRKSRPLPP